MVRNEKVVHPIDRLHRARDEVAVARAAVVGSHLFDRLAGGERVIPLPGGERLLHRRAQAPLQTLQSLGLRHVVARPEEARREQQKRERSDRQEPVAHGAPASVVMPLDADGEERRRHWTRTR